MKFQRDARREKLLREIDEEEAVLRPAIGGPQHSVVAAQFNSLLQ